MQADAVRGIGQSAAHGPGRTSGRAKQSSNTGVVRAGRRRARAKSRDGEAPVATKAIVGEKVGMTQIWDDQHRAVPVTVLRVAPVRVVQVKTPEHEGYCRAAGHLGPPPAVHADQARAGPLRQGRGRCRAATGRAALDDVADYEVGQELTADLLQAGRAGRRHRRVQGEGLRRRHEAPQLQGPGRSRTATTRSTGRPARSAPAPRPRGCSRAPGWPAAWVASR